MRTGSGKNVIWRAALFCLCTTLRAYGQQPAEPTDAQIQSDIQHQLHGKQYRGVHAEVASGAVTLTGEVDRLADKLDAEKRIARTHEAASVNNQIVVNVPPGLSDQQIYTKLGKALAYDREGYGSFPFNSINLRVHDGIAEIGGEVVDPVDKDSAIGLVTDTAGVRGLVDHLQVAPVSPMDWGLRHALYQAVYGAPQLTRYAIDPVKPIRMVVMNGHAVLTGSVISNSDREIAGMRANGVPGLFSVENNIEVAGQGSSSEQHK
ncbi:MAG: BON domain-containing protein [Janthinobacterium lividum]